VVPCHADHIHSDAIQTLLVELVERSAASATGHALSATDALPRGFTAKDIPHASNFATLCLSS
jgi:hypothetical protein